MRVRREYSQRTLAVRRGTPARLGVLSRVLEGTRLVRYMLHANVAQTRPLSKGMADDGTLQLNGLTPAATNRLTPAATNGLAQLLQRHGPAPRTDARLRPQSCSGTLWIQTDSSRRARGLGRQRCVWFRRAARAHPHGLGARSPIHARRRFPLPADSHLPLIPTCSRFLLTASHLCSAAHVSTPYSTPVSTRES